MSEREQSREEAVRKKARREQKYRSEWEKQFPWVRPSKKDAYKAMCLNCNAEVTAQVTTLKLHENTAKHKKMCATAPSSSKTLMESFTSARADSETSKSDSVKSAEIRLTAFMMEHNISFRAADHLCEVLKGCFPDSTIAKELKMKRTKCQKVCVNVMAHSHKQDLINILKQNKFSILVDESTDISTSQNLCIMVRVVEGNAVVTKFWDLVPLFSSEDPSKANEGATAARLFSEIMKTFTENGVPISNIIGFGSDGCSTMMGPNNSVSSRLKELCPGIFIMKCVCHSAHICASEACKQLPHAVEQLAHDVHNTFKNSSKRLAQFVEFQEFAGAQKLRILLPSRTRWLSYTAVVKRMLEQWVPLQMFFTDLNFQQTKTCGSTVRNAYEQLHNPFNRLYYCFLSSVLPKFTQLNLLFQSERVVITELHRQVCNLYKELLMMYMNHGYIVKTALSKVDPRYEREFLMLEQVYLGASVLKRITDNPELSKQKKEMYEFRINCRSFLIVAAEQIRKRFNFEDEVLSRMHMLEPASVLGIQGKVQEQSLVPFAIYLPRIIAQDDSTLQQLDNEWRRLAVEDLPDFITNMAKQVDKIKYMQPDKFWCAIKTLEDSDGNPKFKLVADFALGCLSLPHANADCERCFSSVNRVKTKDRNKLKTETVRDIILAKQSVASTSSSDCTTFKPSKSMIKNMTSRVLYSSTEDAGAADNVPDVYIQDQDQ